MGTKLTLGDIADMKEYLAHRCYCPGEIYDMTGIFFRIFTADTPCRLLCSGTMGSIHGTFVIAKAKQSLEEEIIYIEIEDDIVHDCTRFDATENNISQVLQFMDGEIESMTIDEYNPGESRRAIDDILKNADAIMC